MAITPSQLSSILRVKKEFNLINGSGLLTDLTPWSGYSIIAPDTAKVLLWITTPTGSTLYKNAGYDTDTYTSPDFTLADSTHAFTIPTDVNGEYITGTYTVYAKAQVVDDGDTIYGSASSTAEVCECSVDIEISIDVDYATAQLTSTDATAYGSYFSLTRTHTIFPPPISGLSNQTTSATTNVYTNIVTTTWSVEISSDVVYLKANDTYTTCRLTGSEEVVVEADTLCNVLCLIKKFRTDFYSKFGKMNVGQMEEAYQLAVNEFYLAFMATRCGRPQSEVQTYIDKIYSITGLDPDCDCGCSASDNPTPVVPTSIVNGSDGDDGVTPEFQNTGTWIQVSYDGGSTWNNLFSIASVSGAAGAPGSDGADGANGVAVLENLISDTDTGGTAWETLKQYDIDGDQLSANKDKVEARVRFRSFGARSGQGIRVSFNGSPVASYLFSNNETFCEFIVSITRYSPTEAKIDYKVLKGTGSPGHLSVGMVISEITTVAGLDWTTTKLIEAEGDSVIAGDIICEMLEVIYYKKQ